MIFFLVYYFYKYFGVHYLASFWGIVVVFNAKI